MQTKNYKYYTSLFHAKKICKSDKCIECKTAIELAEKHNRLVLINEVNTLDQYGNVKTIEYHATPENI